MIFIDNSIRLLITTLVLFFSLYFIDINTVYGYETSDSILKINSYIESNGNYHIDQFGSALVIDKDTLLTNAHVVVKEDKTPYLYYDVCGYLVDDISISCFTTAKLLYIDTQMDLAILKFSNKYNLPPVIFSKQESSIGDKITAYGYNSSNFPDIASSQGKISSYYNQYIGIDADISNGDSGGGVVDGDGEVVGMPAFALLYDLSGTIARSNYIIPSKDIVRFINNWKQYKIHKNYYQLPDYNNFLSYISNKHKRQGLPYIKTQDFYFLHDGYGYYLDDVISGPDGYVYLLKSNDQTIEVYISKYTHSDIDEKVSEYTSFLSGVYDTVYTTNLTKDTVSTSSDKYIKIVAQDDKFTTTDTVYLIQKGEDLFHIEIYGDSSRQDYKTMYRKLQNLSRTMIGR